MKIPDNRIATHESNQIIFLCNGSYIQYDVNSFTGKGSVRSVVDVVEEALTMNDKINRLVNNLNQ